LPLHFAKNFILGKELSLKGLGFNSYFDKLKSNFKLHDIYQKIFYTDFNSPIFRGLYNFGEGGAGWLL
jgi:hypothetical protein